MILNISVGIETIDIIEQRILFDFHSDAAGKEYEIDSLLTKKQRMNKRELC